MHEQYCASDVLDEWDTVLEEDDRRYKIAC